VALDFLLPGLYLAYARYRPGRRKSSATGKLLHDCYNRTVTQPLQFSPLNGINNNCATLRPKRRATGKNPRVPKARVRPPGPSGVGCYAIVTWSSDTTSDSGWGGLCWRRARRMPQERRSLLAGYRGARPRGSLLLPPYVLGQELSLEAATHTRGAPR
jgi:hypothetical protein